MAERFRRLSQFGGTMVQKKAAVLFALLSCCRKTKTNMLVEVQLLYLS